MVYVAGVLLVLLLIAGGYAKIERADRIAAEAKVTACEARIEKQNEAIKTTKEEGDRRVAAAKKGVVQAGKETAAARSEAARLRKLQEGKGPTGPCPAGVAMSEIRKGLLK